jgi:nucleotide-binding universal stress UspA family protein
MNNIRGAPMAEIEIKKMLYPVALTDISEKIVPHVVFIADKFDSQIHLIFVARMGRKEFLETPESVLSRATERLREFAEAHFSDYALKIKVVSGDPADKIVEYIDTEGIDLVVMGTHGRKGLEKILLGSVAAEVVSRSTAPVVTINPYRIPVT